MQLKRFAAGTDLGLQRNNNEDCYLCSPGRGLWLVADGMGGHAAGEVASEIASTTLQNRVGKGQTLATAIQEAHHAILIAASKGVGGQGMGSTVVALLSRAGKYQIGWVGDSRAYLWSPNKSPKLQQITRDHSYVQMLFDSGAIAEEELRTHPEKNIITQCLGSLDLDYVQVDTLDGSWLGNEKILLCSDGLSDFVSLTDMEKILGQDKDMDVTISELISLALENGGRDNITVVLVSAPDKWTIFYERVREFFSRFFRGKKIRTS